jgi:hypothetical protein
MLPGSANLRRAAHRCRNHFEINHNNSQVFTLSTRLDDHVRAMLLRMLDCFLQVFRCFDANTDAMALFPPCRLHDHSRKPLEDFKVFLGIIGFKLARHVQASRFKHAMGQPFVITAAHCDGRC